MKVNLKEISRPKPIEISDVPKGTWLCSLDPINTQKFLIFTNENTTAVIAVDGDEPLYLDEDAPVYNLTKVKVASINLEEV